MKSVKSLPKKKFVLRGVAVCVVVYAGVLAWYYANQRSLMYHPDKVVQDPSGYGLGMAAFTVPSEDGTPISLWYRPATPGNRTIVFFHGNAGNLGTRVEKFQTFLKDDYGLLAVSYRGFGASAGEPTEDGIYQDARTAVKWVLAKGVPEEKMILYGESLGTAVAVKMATEFRQAWALVLEAPFASMASVGRVHYPFLPVSLLLKDRFDSRKTIRDVQMPVLIAHGTVDTVVPPSEGEKLLKAANDPKRLLLLPGFRHDNMDVKSILITMNTFVSISRSAEQPMQQRGSISIQPVGVLPSPINPALLELKAYTKTPESVPQATPQN